MAADLFTLQRSLGEELLAAGWHAASIAVASQPSSAWALADPTRRIRVRMRADLVGVLAEVTATHRPSTGLFVPRWRLTIHHAPTVATLAALRAAPLAEVGTGRDKRAITRALHDAGMRPDRCALVRTLSGACVWTTPDREGEAVWIVPHRAEPGGWAIHTGRHKAYLQATIDTPAAVLVPLIAGNATPRTEGNR